MGESLVDAVKRVAKDEAGIEVQKCHFAAYIEYPKHYKNEHGWPVGMAFEIDEYKGIPTPLAGASEGAFLKTIPSNMHVDQGEFLIENGYLDK